MVSYFRKDTTHATLFYGRDFLINMLEEALFGLPEWSREVVPFRLYNHSFKWELFNCDYAVVNIKTGDGVSPGTNVDWTNKRKELPYWGTSEDLKRRIWGEPPW